MGQEKKCQKNRSVVFLVAGDVSGDSRSWAIQPELCGRS